jgi:hypothetical protein
MCFVSYFTTAPGAGLQPKTLCYLQTNTPNRANAPILAPRTYSTTQMKLQVFPTAEHLSLTTDIIFVLHMSATATLQQDARR